MASLTKEVENTAVKQLAADGSLKADASWPQGAKDYWDVKMEERQLRNGLEQAKNNLKYLEDPTNIQLQRTQAVNGGDPDQDNTQAIANAKKSIDDYNKKLNENLNKQKGLKVSAGDLKVVEAKLNVSIKGEKTGDNITTDGVANSIAGKASDLIGTTKNLLTQGNWEFMGPPGGYLYDSDATRNNKSHPGTISLFISNHMVVHNLLVSNVDIDVSQFVTVEGYPLWVRADISFVPAALFTSRDIARSLGGSGRIYGLWDESLANADASNKGGTKQYTSNFKAIRYWEVESKVRRDGHNEKDENQRFANLGFDPNGEREGVFSNWSKKKNPDNQNYRVVIVNEEKERVNKEISKAETKLKNDSKGYNIDSSQNSATFRAALDRSSDVAKNAMEAINSAQRSNPGFKSLNQNQMKGFMDKFELKRTALEAPLYNFLGQKQN